MSRQDENQPDQNVCSCPTNTGQINGLISNLELTFDLDLEVLQKIHIDVPMHMDCEVTKIHSPEVGISEYSSKNKKSSSKQGTDFSYTCVCVYTRFSGFLCSVLCRKYFGQYTTKIPTLIYGF